MDSNSVLSVFKEITRIPRESGHEGPMTAFLQKFAADRNLTCKTDKTGNVLIIKGATPGRMHIAPLVLQAHQDMVCEKKGSFEFDFRKDPIPYEIEDGWMIARDTTLGADDGIGIAACLALLDSDLPMGKVECLFTISEETGMDGAFALEKGFFDGKTLINLDSEDEGQLFVGCAGGIDTRAEIRYETEPLEKNFKPMRLRISGATGGHSGDDINKERANVLQQLCRFLYTQLQYDYQLISISGGNKANAICREAEAVIAVPDDEFQDMVTDFQAFSQIVKDEFKNTESELKFESKGIRYSGEAISSDVAGDIIATLNACPHGVVAMSTDIPGLVETSTNFAIVKTEKDNRITVVTNQRSSVNSALHAIAEKVEAVFILGGFDVEHTGEYPGWKPNLDSRILEQSVRSYRKLFGTEPEVKAIHAGLECGLFLEKFPDLDMISFGPTLRGVHAPGERLELASLDKFVELLKDIVTNFV